MYPINRESARMLNLLYMYDITRLIMPPWNSNRHLILNLISPKQVFVPIKRQHIINKYCWQIWALLIVSQLIKVTVMQWKPSVQLWGSFRVAINIRGMVKVDLFTFSKIWNEVNLVIQWWHSFSSRLSKGLYHVYLYHILLFTYQLFQLVNTQMTHALCIVTSKHEVGHSYGQALIYIHKWHEAGNRWVHVYWK